MINFLKLSYPSLQLLLFFFLSFSLSAQSTIQKDDYQFTIDQRLDCSSVKNQQRSNTCWSFSATSFLESELMRQGKEVVDLSDMYAVRYTYLRKARKYLRYHGKTNFSEGSLGHDVINVLRENGIVPESVFDGKPEGTKQYDHRGLFQETKAYLDALLDNPPIPVNWREGFVAILDKHLDAVPTTFEYEGEEYSPQTFAIDVLQLNPDDYISFTSFSHHPFYKPFVLEVPDNFSDGLFYNLPLHEFMALTDHALKNGFTIEWDGDVSEKGFAARQGLAIFPEKDWNDMSEDEKKMAFIKPVPQKKVTLSLRQERFDNHQLTDDHLMHLIGTAKDQNGDQYYIIKNSWGKSGLGFDNGYVYFSEAYYKMNTISIMVHKDAVPSLILQKLSL